MFGPGFLEEFIDRVGLKTPAVIHGYFTEHMESAEHIAPQHNYPIPGKTSRYICVRSCCGMSERRTGARTQFVPRPGALRLQLDSEIVPKLPGEAHAAARASATSVV